MFQSDVEVCPSVSSIVPVRRPLGCAVYRSEDPFRRKLLLIVSAAGNLGIMGFFKYFNSFTESSVDLLSIFGRDLDFAHLNIVLPVGISFYTFKTMSYTIDIYRRKPAPDVLPFSPRSRPDILMNFVKYIQQ